MTVVNKKVFKVEVAGKEVEIAVVRPTVKAQQEAQREHNKALRDALENKALLRAKIESYMRDQQLWDDGKQARHDTLTKSLREGERKLKAGNIRWSEAKKIALQMRKDRGELRSLTSYRGELEQHSAEGQAEQSRFNYLVVSCTLDHSTDKPYFKDVKDYLERTDDPVPFRAAIELGNLLFNLDPDFEKRLPENSFLLKAKILDDKLRFINKEGKLTDEEGRLIDGQGRHINSNNEFVDRDGNRVDELGELIVSEPLPFLDEEDKPIAEIAEPAVV